MSNIAFFLPHDKPTIFSLPQNVSLQELQAHLSCDIIDSYDLWQKELFEIEHPLAVHEKMQEFLLSQASPHHGSWAYYPWKKAVIHIPPIEEFKKVFFSRNFPIFEQRTQNKLEQMTIAVAGLSVGSNIAIELVRAGIYKLRIADFDSLAPSNNNRITGGSIFQIGENKTSLLAKKIYELNPYCDIEIFPQGISLENAKKFIQDCDIIIDEIDAFPIKNFFRDYIHSEAGKHTILITGADLGENPLVEIETYADPKFGGRVNEKDIEFILQGNPTKIESTKMLVSVVGRENIPPSFLQNFINIKKNKQTYWAQVGLAATAVAAKITAIVVDIARGNTHKLKRLYQLNLRDTINQQEEQQINHVFNKEFGYIPPTKKTIFLPDEASLNIKKLMGIDGKNIRHIKIGDLAFYINEIPAHLLTKKHLQIIHTARESYKMWGDDIDFFIHDPSDMHWEEGLWETRHIFAYVTGPNAFRKVFILKHSRISYDHLTALERMKRLPIEFAIWNFKNNKTNEEKSLWKAFNEYIHSYPKDRALTINSRFCAISERKNENKLEKDATAITFAAMQLFISETLPNVVVTMVTPESIKKLFTINSNKQKIQMIFNPFQKTLGLKSTWEITLNNKNPIFNFHRRKLPNYWAKNPLPFMTDNYLWRKGAINLLKAAKEKYT